MTARTLGIRWVCRNQDPGGCVHKNDGLEVRESARPSFPGEYLLVNEDASRSSCCVARTYRIPVRPQSCSTPGCVEGIERFFPSSCIAKLLRGGAPVLSTQTPHKPRRKVLVGKTLLPLGVQGCPQNALSHPLDNAEVVERPDVLLRGRDPQSRARLTFGSRPLGNCVNGQ